MFNALFSDFRVQADNAHPDAARLPRAHWRRPAPAAPAAPEAPAPSPTVNPEVVAYLTTLLARAKRGEIQAFGFASVDHEHVVRHSLYVGSGEYQNGLVAAVAYLSHELVAQNLSEDEEDEED
jgi:hypothetical protein